MADLRNGWKITLSDYKFDEVIDEYESTNTKVIDCVDKNDAKLKSDKIIEECKSKKGFKEYKYNNDGSITYMYKEKKVSTKTSLFITNNGKGIKKW